MAKTSDDFSYFLNPVQGFQTPLDIPSYSLNTPLSGQFLSFFDNPEEDNEEKSGLTEDEYRKEKIKLMEDSIKLRNKLLSPEYRDAEIARLDDLQAKQMARAQKYGKESAFYGFMYQGLPNLMAQAAFSKYAFAPEMVKGVTDAYSRINASPAGMTNYMAVNPMGRGIG